MPNFDHPNLTAKALGLYRQLAVALDVITDTAESEDGGADGTAVDLAASIRDLGTELEQMLDDDQDADGGGDFDRAARIRVLEREISALLTRVQRLERQPHCSRDGGWSY